MRRILAVLCLIAVLATAILIGCAEKSPLESALAEYSKVVEGEPPEDIRMTIYYIPFGHLTSLPISKEMLIEHPNVGIRVRPEEVISNWMRFRELKPSTLQIASQKTEHRNARLCYILEVGDGQGNYQVILDVLMDYADGNAIVNGVEVEHCELLLDLIHPLMPEEKWEDLMY